MLSGIAKKIAVGVCMLAVAIGLIGKIQPHVFLKIPNVGFIFWAITGNHMPPHFDNRVWHKKHFRKWAQDGDIIQATMAKAGTVWTAQITHLLKNNGEDNYENLHDVFGVIEMIHYPGESVDHRIKREDAKRKPGQPMSWSTNQFPSDEFYGLNPTLNPTIKYIVVARDGKEIMRSFFPFMNAHTDRFRKTYGGFPPLMTEKKEVVQMCALDLPNFFFGHMKAWWQYRNEPNVLFVHYKNLKKNSRHEIERIAKFIDIDVESSKGKKLLDTVVKKSSFDYMKKQQERVQIFFGPKEDRYPAIEMGKHMNQGQAGGADAFFDDEMNEMWETAKALHWKDADPKMIEWLQKGGTF